MSQYDKGTVVVDTSSRGGDRGSSLHSRLLRCVVVTAAFLACHAQAVAGCPSSPERAGDELADHGASLGFVKGQVKCCSACFPDSASDLTRRYSAWAAPAHSRMDALLKCFPGEAMATRAVLSAGEYIYEHSSVRQV